MMANLRLECDGSCSFWSWRDFYEMYKGFKRAGPSGANHSARRRPALKRLGREIRAGARLYQEGTVMEAIVHASSVGAYSEFRGTG